MRYARIDLDKTNYQIFPDHRWEIFIDPPADKLEEIYNNYCVSKNFESVLPIFPEEYTDPKNDVFGYYNETGDLVGFSLIRVYNNHSAEAIQFAWDYAEPKLRLGIESLKHECAWYKKQGLKHFYLGGADEYKSMIDGFEIVGPRK